MQQRRVALLGKKCWGSAEETQPYDHDATLRYVPAEASPCRTHGGEAVHVAYPPSPPVPKVPQEEDTRNKSQEHDDRTTETPFPTEPDPKDAMDDLQGKQLEPPTPPVLPGCLDKNFKCPVVMLEHDVRVIMATGFTKEMAEEALVKARGSLPEAMGLLIRARYGIPKPHKPDTKELQNRPEQKVETTMEPKAEPKVEAKGEPTSPSPMDIVAAASPVTRRDQREFREQLKAVGSEEEGEEGDDDEEEKPTRKTRVKSKAKAQAKAKAKAKAKGKTKKKADDNGVRGKGAKGKGANSSKEPKGPSKKPATKSKGKDHKEPDSSPKTRKLNNGKKTPVEPKVSADTGKREKATFAGRYIPKTQPLRSVWVAARKAFVGIKGELKAASKKEDRFPSSHH